MPKPAKQPAPVASDPGQMLSEALDKLPLPIPDVGLVDTAMRDSPAHRQAKLARIHEMGHGLDARSREDWMRGASTLSLDEVMDFKKKHIQDFVGHFRHVLDSAGGQSLIDMAKMGRFKRGWYRNFAKVLFNLFDHDDAHRFAAVLAATSPQTGVEFNLPHALDIWHEWNRAGRPQKKSDLDQFLLKTYDKWKKAGHAELRSRGGEPKITQAISKKSGKSFTKDETPGLIDVDGEQLRTAGNPNFGAYSNNVKTTLGFVKGGDWRNQFRLSGPKVEAFRQNLTGNFEDATLDSWMAKLFSHDQKLFGKSKRHFYKATKAAMATTIDTMNRVLSPGEQPWTMAELQETVWSVMKTLTESQAASQDPHPDLLHTFSKLTHGDIADTVDFISLMVNDESIGKRLKAFGLDKVLNRLATLHRGVQEKSAPTFAEGLGGGHEDILERLRGTIDTAAARSRRQKALVSRKRKEREAKGLSQLSARTMSPGLVAILNA